MSVTRPFSGRNAASRSGLSLIEIMVTVTLLVVIILGLTAMFNQTRKAFTVGLSNVDYQDAGRAALDLISRDLQQMAPSDFSFFTTNTAHKTYFTNALNFYAGPSFNEKMYAWPMTGTDVTNFSLMDLYFLTRYNQQWTAVGYRLVGSEASNGVGTLYRFSTNIQDVQHMSTLGPFQVNIEPNANVNTQVYYFREDGDPPPAPAAFSRVIDGVVDFRIRAYDRNGLLIPTFTNGFVTTVVNNRIETLLTNYTGNAREGFNFNYLIDPNVSIDPIYTNYNIAYVIEPTGDYTYQFLSNAVPAYVDLELGILETPTYQQLQALTNSQSAYLNFLTNHAAQVHVFRQRITIPSVDPTAYP